MVEAVPIVLQWPTDGADEATISMNSSWSILPAARSSRALQADMPEPQRSPFHQPFSIGPPDSTIAGMFTVALAHALGEFQMVAVAGREIGAGLGDADDRLA